MSKFCTVCVSILMAFSIKAFAADQTKIGVLTIPKILQQSSQMQDISNQLKKRFKPRQDKIIALQKKLTDDQAKLKRDASVMSSNEAKKLQDSIASDQRDLRRLEEDYLSDARAAQKDAIDKIMKSINKIVQKIADKDNYDLIIQEDYVVFAKPTINISDQVIKALKETP